MAKRSATTDQSGIPAGWGGKNTLLHVRRATKAKDGYDGELYQHRWPTGFQHLIFNSHEHARRWLFEANQEAAKHEKESSVA